MVKDKSLIETLYHELNGWRQTAIKSTATGAFLGYEEEFVKWVNNVDKTVRGIGSLPSVARELEKAKSLLQVPSDDFFEEMFEHLENALNMMLDSGLTISKEILEAFVKACKENNDDPKKVIEEHMTKYTAKITSDE